jgi:hypothetical protein
MRELRTSGSVGAPGGRPPGATRRPTPPSAAALPFMVTYVGVSWQRRRALRRSTRRPLAARRDVREIGHLRTVRPFREMGYPRDRPDELFWRSYILEIILISRSGRCPDLNPLALAGARWPGGQSRVLAGVPPWATRWGRGPCCNHEPRGGGAWRGGPPPRPQAGGRGQVVVGSSCTVTRDRESAGHSYEAPGCFLPVTRGPVERAGRRPRTDGEDPAKTADAGGPPRGHA